MSGIAPTQNGIGVREAAQVALFAPFGVPAGLALATGLVFEVIIIVGGLIGGVIALVMGFADASAHEPGATAVPEFKDTPAPRTVPPTTAPSAR